MSLTKSKFIKIYLAILLVFTACIIFTGCAQTIQLTTIYADGSRSYSYTITLQQALNEYNITTASAMEQINESVTNYWTRFSTGRNLNGVNFVHGISENNSQNYQILLSFNTFENFRDFVGLTDDTESTSTPDIREYAFISEYVIEDTNLETTNDLLFEMQIVPALANQIAIDFADAFFDGNLESVTALFNNIETSIIRAYPTSLKIKANADDSTNFIANYGVTRDELATYTAYLWQCTLSNPTPHIYIYQNVYTTNNLLAWYGLGIGSALVFGAILWAILYYRHRKNSNTTTISNNNDLVIDATATPLTQKDENKDTQINFNNKTNFEKEFTNSILIQDAIDFIKDENRNGTSIQQDKNIDTTKTENLENDNNNIPHSNDKHTPAVPEKVIAKKKLDDIKQENKSENTEPRENLKNNNENLENDSKNNENTLQNNSLKNNENSTQFNESKNNESKN